MSLSSSHQMPSVRLQPKVTPPARPRPVIRAEKVLWKAAWSLFRATAPAVKLRELHRRLVQRPGGEVIEYVRAVDEPALIEPVYGYIVTEQGVLVEESLNTNNPYRNPWRHGLPDPRLGRQLRRGQRPAALRFKRVILLRHWWEWNYYIFFADVLGKLNLLDSVGLDPDTPIVVGQYVMELPWAAEIIRRGGFGARRWIIPDRQYVAADEVVYCRTQQNFKERMDPVLDALEVPRALDQFSERVFLNRAGNSGRRLTNLDEIWYVLQAFDFKMVDAAQLTVAQQIETFSKVGYLVAPHGAGITNIVFRRGAPLKLLELQSRLYPESHVLSSFGTICRAYGYGWDRLAGEPADARIHPQHGNYSIAPVALQERLLNWFG